MLATPVYLTASMCFIVKTFFRFTNIQIRYQALEFRSISNIGNDTKHFHSNFDAKQGTKMNPKFKRYRSPFTYVMEEIKKGVNGKQ